MTPHPVPTATCEGSGGELTETGNLMANTRREPQRSLSQEASVLPLVLHGNFVCVKL